MKRRQPLRRGAKPKRKIALAGKGRPRKTIYQKGRIVASQGDYAELVYRTVWGQECACGCHRRANTAHHLVARGNGGDDVLDNLVPLAGDGTRLCHGAFTNAVRTYDADTGGYCDPAQVAHGIRAYLDNHPEKTAYVVRKKGQAWLDWRYPRKEADVV